MVTFLFFLSGTVAGLLAGLLGIGGGLILVPALSYLLLFTDIPLEQTMQVAISTSLASTFVTSSLSSWKHHQKKGIDYSLVRLLAPGLFVGCLLGAWTTAHLPSQPIRQAFGALCILLSIYFIFPKMPPIHLGSHPKRTLPFWGFAIGTVSSMLGIGGGVFTVPILQGHQISLKNAVATSSGATLLTTFAATLSYLFLSWNQPNTKGVIGFIDLPAFFAISAGALLSTPWGVRLSHSLSPIILKRIFAAVLCLVGLRMLPISL